MLVIGNRRGQCSIFSFLIPPKYLRLKKKMIQAKEAYYYLHFHTFFRKCVDLLTASGFPIFTIFSSLGDVSYWTYSIVEQLHKF